MLLKAFLFFASCAVGFMMPPDAIDGVYYVEMTPQGQVRTSLNETGPSPLHPLYYSGQNLISTAVCTNAHLGWAGTNNAVTELQYKCGFLNVLGNGAIYLLEGTTRA
jgi:hypothetical protein